MLGDCSNVAHTPAAACNPDGDEVGDRGVYSAYDFSSSDTYCILWNPTCTGTLRYAYAYHVDRGGGADDDNVQVLIATDDGGTAGTPDATDTVLGSTLITDHDDGLGENTTGWVTNSTDLNIAVNVATPVWLCFTPGANNWNGGRTASGTHNVYFQDTSPTWYNAAPATLTGSWTGPTANRDYSFYVEID